MPVPPVDPPKRWEAETCSWVSATVVLPLRGRRREAAVVVEAGAKAGAKAEADERQQQRARAAARLLEDI